jgi:hypothetical protein
LRPISKSPVDNRLLRLVDPSFFSEPDQVAVLDQKQNVVYFNNLFAGDVRLERRALLISTPLVLYLPANYFAE